MTNIDGIESLHREATEGIFTMDVHTARHCADVTARLIESLEREIDLVSRPIPASFGTLQSGREMEAGFTAKMLRLEEVLGEYRNAAQRLKESFEIAGKLIDATEADTEADLRRAGESA